MFRWSPGMTLESVERDMILQAMAFYHGNKTLCAQSLGISTRTIYEKLDKYEIEAKEQIKREEAFRAQRQVILDKQRGSIKEYFDQIPTLPGSFAGPQLEPAPQVPTQPAVPVPERQEVQSVPSKQAGHGGHKRNR